MPGTGIQIGQFGNAQIDGRTGGAGSAIEGGVMQKHGNSIAAESDIQLDAVDSESEGVGNGGSSVFGGLMGSRAMGDRSGWRDSRGKGHRSRILWRWGGDGARRLERRGPGRMPTATWIRSGWL